MSRKQLLTSFITLLDFLSSASFSVTPCKTSHLSFHSPDPRSTKDAAVLPIHTASLYYLLCYFRGLSNYTIAYNLPHFLLSLPFKD